MISIHAPLTGSDFQYKLIIIDGFDISIHAPLTGSDSLSRISCSVPRSISIHAPLTGSDCAKCTKIQLEIVFQSTLPLRGATLSDPVLFIPRVISIHAPLTGSDKVPLQSSKTGKISIHAPLTGSDVRAQNAAARKSYFNPRSPYGERPCRSDCRA